MINGKGGSTCVNFLCARRARDPSDQSPRLRLKGLQAGKDTWLWIGREPEDPAAEEQENEGGEEGGEVSKCFECDADLVGPICPVCAAPQSAAANTETRLGDALRSINHATHWYFVCAGAVSHDDIRSMMTEVKRELEGVHDLLFDQDLPDGDAGEALSNDF